MYTARFGNMWDRWGEPNSLFCITTNNFIRRDGALVMGRGIARQVRDIMPELAWAAAVAIRAQPIPHVYGFVVLPAIQPATRLCSAIKQMVGLFQVKDHFRSPADLKLIEHSAQLLKAYLVDHPEYTEVNLNFPGIGNGHRTVEEVVPLLQDLPSIVHVWRFERERPAKVEV